VVFGDSLMDAGYICAVTSGATPSAASGDYSGRFSNGPVPSDVLDQAVEGTLSSPSLLGGNDVRDILLGADAATRIAGVVWRS